MTAAWEVVQLALAIIGFVTVVCFVVVLAIVAFDKTPPSEPEPSDFDKAAEEAVRVVREFRS